MPTPQSWLDNLDRLNKIANGITVDPEVFVAENQTDEAEVDPEDAKLIGEPITKIAEETLRLLETAPPEVKVSLLSFVFALIIAKTLEAADGK